MGIQGALYSGVSGMTVNSTSMEVIGNNIANSNTYGYKTSRTVFSDALNNAVSSSSGVAQVGSGAMLFVLWTGCSYGEPLKSLLRILIWPFRATGSLCSRTRTPEK